MTDIIVNAIESAAKEVVKIITITNKSKPWWTDELSTLKLQASKAKREAHGLEGEHQLSREARKKTKEFRRAINQVKRKQGRLRASNMTEQNLWKTIRRAKGDSSRQTTIPPLEINADKLATTPDEKRQALIEKFFPAANNSNLAKDWSMNQQYCSPCPNPTISEDEVQNALWSMKLDSAPGADGIPLIVFQECWDILKTPITTMIQRSLEIGHIPNRLKEGLTISLKKPGRHLAKHPKDYRPITMLNC